jgi:hypothetical protein
MAHGYWYNKKNWHRAKKENCGRFAHILNIDSSAKQIMCVPLATCMLTYVWMDGVLKNWTAWIWNRPLVSAWHRRRTREWRFASIIGRIHWTTVHIWIAWGPYQNSLMPQNTKLFSLSLNQGSKHGHRFSILWHHCILRWPLGQSRSGKKSKVRFKKKMICLMLSAELLYKLALTFYL